MSDLVVTWPKTRCLASYISALHDAKAKALKVNYRTGGNPPQRSRVFDGAAPRLYRVHDGAVRGYTPIIDVVFHATGEVARVADDPISDEWPEGWYIMCEPEFFDCKPLSMKGFQGFRWFDRTRVPL